MTQELERDEPLDQEIAGSEEVEPVQDTASEGDTESTPVSEAGDESAGDEELYTLLIDGREESYTPSEMAELLSKARQVVDRWSEFEKVSRELEQKRQLYEQYERLAHYIAGDRLLTNVISWKLQGYSDRAIINALMEYSNQFENEEEEMETSEREEHELKTRVEQLQRELEQQKLIEQNQRVFLQVMGELGYSQGLSPEEAKKLEGAIRELYPDIDRNLRLFTPEQVRAIFRAAGLTGKRGPELRQQVVRKTAKPPRQVPAVGAPPGQSQGRSGLGEVISSLSQRKQKYYEL